MGTMPHALIIYMGDQRAAWKIFDDRCPKEVPRIALVDTYADEKTEAVMAAETIKLDGVRLDTPQSRRGDMNAIIKEVRWELELRGYHVPIVVSGGIDEEAVGTLSANGFGIGTAVSNAPIIDFAMDLIEVEGKPCAKRGKWGGKKQVYRCPACMRGRIVPEKGKGAKGKEMCECGKQMEPKLELLIKDGKVVRPLPKPLEIRKFVLQQLGIADL
jgi:nicotinate phosphoribosyltransferase